LLCHEHKSGRAFIKHRTCAAGGNEIDMAIADFISQVPPNLEHQALFRLIADGAGRADRAGATQPAPKTGR
jgi:hypothetical protein